VKCVWLNDLEILNKKKKTSYLDFFGETTFLSVKRAEKLYKISYLGTFLCYVYIDFENEENKTENNTELNTL
jgi:hypothetical protein